MLPCAPLCSPVLPCAPLCSPVCPCVLPCALGLPGLVQILANVVEEIRVSIHQDINGADLLYSLLNAPWLQSLLKVRARDSLCSRSGSETHSAQGQGQRLTLLKVRVRDSLCSRSGSETHSAQGQGQRLTLLRVRVRDSLSLLF